MVSLIGLNNTRLVVAVVPPAPVPVPPEAIEYCPAGHNMHAVLPKPQQGNRKAFSNNYMVGVCLRTAAKGVPSKPGVVEYWPAGHSGQEVAASLPHAHTTNNQISQIQHSAFF
jgi:hypothetical protein